MTSGIKWLASYPKSGNTWARLFLLNWYLDADEPIEPEELARRRFIPSDDTEWLWEDATGLEPDVFNAPASLKLRTHVQRYWAGVGGEYPAFLKTHSVNGKIGPFEFIDWGATSAAVYFVRDPRKVAASYADHMGKDVDWSIEQMNSPDHFLGRHERLFTSLGPWSRHVESWQSRATVIKFEDLPDGFAAMLEAFGLPMDERFEKAKKFTRIGALKKMERERGFSERGHDSHVFFGGKRSKLTPGQTFRLEKDHERIMRDYGYI